MTRRGYKRGHVGALTNITRCPGAWSVHIRRQGRVHPGWFADAVWGGRQPALLCAQRFRDAVLLRLDADTRVRRRPPKGRRRNTGPVGVRLEPHVVGGRAYPRYVGDWVDEEGVTRRRRFAVQAHGRQRARFLATSARRAGAADSRRERLLRQREDAVRRLRSAPPAPKQVKAPRSRKGIKMPPRRPFKVQ